MVRGDISLKHLKKVYSGKKVLITGHTGFKGAWLAQILILSGAKVTGYSLKPNTNPSLFKILGLQEKIDSVIGDIRSLKKFNRLVKKTNPDIIFHLAAQPLVRSSYDDPVYTFETNVLGTVNVLEAIRLTNIPAGVIITTDKVYDNIEDPSKLYEENDKLGGHDPYSASKACADIVCSSYEKSFMFKSGSFVASARSGNVIGGGDWAEDRLIPDAVRAIYKDKKALVLRNPTAVRPWQHVFEPLAGYLLLGEKLLEQNKKAQGAWNFAPEEKDMREVSEVIEKFIELSGQGAYEVILDKSKHEAGNLKLSNKKSKSGLGFKPRLKFSEALLMTADWYKNYYLKKDMKEFSTKQIRRYFR